MQQEHYEKYLCEWLEGIKYEISFWDHFMSSKGKNCNLSPEKWNFLSQYEMPFLMEEEIDTPSAKILDAGSGPFSCGSAANHTRIELTAVDPLAAIYNNLKKKYYLTTKITPETCMVELLNFKFKENEFDIVHMKNALDHSFNPVLGLLQMLYVCKIGGKLILFHAQNEAEQEHYHGFHQWNLYLDVNDKFSIWRKNEKICAESVLKDYAKIEKAQKIVDINGKKHHKIVIKKLKNSPLMQDENLGILITQLLQKIMELNLEKYDMRHP